ncbi:MAG TPA: helix-turn-helix transcriptional regulator, partial [Burkholderiales bacterium]|nr:helix-turn-helix transcriptional regulator [Burkholderiales bacterium]
MNDDPGVARIASLLADPARARILRTLIDGTMRPAGELAYAANISAQSASAHLAKLVDGGLLCLEAQGRHRYFRLASAEVADAVESLGSLSMAVRPRNPRSPVIPKSAPVQFLHARTCYDHL